MLPFFINGASRGAAYALVAVGLVLIFRTSRVVNFAHGAIATVAAFTFSALRTQLTTAGALLVGVGVAAALGLLIERTTMRRLQERGPAAKLVATVGWLLVLQFGAGLVFGDQTRIVAPILPAGSVPIAGVHVGYSQLGLAAVMLAAAAGLSLWLTRTRFGTSLRAVAQDRSSAQMLGVDAGRVTAVAWGVGGVLAGVAGILYAPEVTLDAIAVTVLLFHAFGAALLANFTSIWGAVVAGLLLGGAEDTAQYFYDRAGTRDLVMFVIILAALLLRSPDRESRVTTPVRRVLADLRLGALSSLRRRPGPSG
jgi:branched-chain amino acid transport system permease protein